MEWWQVLIGLALLVGICALDRMGGGNNRNQNKKFNKGDLIVNKNYKNEHAGDYCVHCCSRGYEVVFSGSLADCERFIATSTSD